MKLKNEKILLFKQAKEIKEFFPIILPFIYFIGFLYLKSYYDYFGINIVYYIGINDLVVEGLYILLLFASIYFSFAFVLYLLENILIKYLKDTVSYSNIKFWIPVCVSILCLVSYLFVLSYSNLLSLIFVIASVFGLIKSSYILYLGWKENRGVLKIVFFLFCSILLLIVFFIGFRNARSNKMKEVFGTSLSFEIDGLKYKTSNKGLRYIGETREYFFLHNIEMSETLIFRKEKLENIVFKKIRFEEYEKFQFLKKGESVKY